MGRFNSQRCFVETPRLSGFSSIFSTRRSRRSIAGSPETAPADVLASVKEKYRPLTEARAATAKRVAARLGVRGT